eukprot:8214786-Karenia_brevis.AAC.1
MAQQQPEHDDTDDEDAAAFWNDLWEADDPRLTVSAEWLQFVSDKGGPHGMVHWLHHQLLCTMGG